MATQVLYQNTKLFRLETLRFVTNIVRNQQSVFVNPNTITNLTKKIRLLRSLNFPDSPTRSSTRIGQQNCPFHLSPGFAMTVQKSNHDELLPYGSDRSN